MRKLKLKFAEFLRKWLFSLMKEFNDQEHLERLAAVRSFFHETLPALDEKFEGKAIIEGGNYNYFELPSGKLPHYDFVLPEMPLYVCVPGIISANWEEARERGITRGIWEEAQLDLLAMEKATRSLTTLNMAIEPQFLIIKWDDPVNHLILAERIGVLTK